MLYTFNGLFSHVQKSVSQTMGESVPQEMMRRVGKDEKFARSFRTSFDLTFLRESRNNRGSMSSYVRRPGSRLNSVTTGGHVGRVMEDSRLLFLVSAALPPSSFATQSVMLRSVGDQEAVHEKSQGQKVAQPQLLAHDDP